MKSEILAIAEVSIRKHLQLGMILGFSLLINLWSANDSAAAQTRSCPPEVKSGTHFPMTDSNKVTWHNSNSINFKLDYEAVCSWKDVTPSKRKEGHVCTYITFSECSIGGTPANAKFYLTDYKPKIKANAK